MTKVCCTCKTIQDLNLFCKNKNNADGLSAQCKICAKSYRELNKDKIKDYPSSSKQYKSNYYDENKDHINFLRREKRTAEDAAKVKIKYNSDEEYRQKVLNYNKNWYSKNKTYFCKKNKKYSSENSDYIYLKNRKRSEKLLKFKNITQVEIDELLNQYNHKCFYCNIEVKKGINLHLDHKIPLSRNGEHSINNLAPSCKTCNLKKGTKTDLEFFKLLK